MPQIIFYTPSCRRLISLPKPLGDNRVHEAIDNTYGLLVYATCLLMNSHAQDTCHAVYQLLQTTEMSNSKDRIVPSHATNPLLSGLSLGVYGSVVTGISPIVRSRVAPSTHTAASRGVWRPQDSMVK